MQVRVYELGQLSMKFERHFDAEIVDLQAWHLPSPSAVCSSVQSIFCGRLNFRTDSSCAGAQILSEDYSKVAFLCADRSVHLHARYGAHFRTRVPCFGRDMAYAPESADLLVAGSAPEIYR